MMLIKMWLDPGAPPQLAGLHIPHIGSRLVQSLSIVYPLKLIRAGCGTRFRGMRSLTFAACGNKTLFSIIFTTSPLAKSWIRAWGTIWKDRDIRKQLNMKLAKALMNAASHYIWSSRMDNERRLQAAETWCYRTYRRMMRISWMEKRTNKSIQDELQTRRELLSHIIKRKNGFLLTCM